MARLLIPFGLASTGLLFLSLLLGYAARLSWASPLLHVDFSMAATLAVLLHQSWSLFYLLGVTRRIRQLATEEPLRNIRPLPSLPRSLAPLGVAATASTMGAFLLGAGAHTGVVDPALHGLTAVLAVGLQWSSATQEARSLAAISAVIREVED